MTSSHQANSNMLDSSVTAAASITDVSRMVGLSRARFYQLVKAGVFPPPVYDIRTRRPYFTETMQKICLNIKKHNLGHNGQPILFYSRRKAPFKTPKLRPSARRNKKNKQYEKWNGIVEGLKSLGLDGVKSAQVEAVICSSYPDGTKDIDEGELLRTCYRKLRGAKYAPQYGR